MTARELRLERVLLAMFLEAEQVAVTGYETCTYPGGVFNDAVWRRKEPDLFKIVAAARKLLGLQPFTYNDALRFGKAGDRLDLFRKKQWALLKKENTK